MRKGLVLLIALMISSAINAADEQRLLIHRIGPSAATLHTARADGSGERPILAQSALDYNASPSPDGQWIVFTSERNGSADIYRARMDGASLERLTEHPAYDDQASWSPDGTKIAFVSSRASGTTDVWTLDLRTKAARNLTAAPGGDFRPSWSPDGRWIAFSSDRGTEIERDLPEWEHLQRTSIYVVHPGGTGLRRLTHGERFAGSPKWSSDAKRVMFYELNVMDTHKVRGGRQSQVDSQIVSIDLQMGGRREHTSGPGLKVSPQFLAGDNIGYLVKAGPNPGIVYTLGGRGVTGDVRNPAWSTDGGVVVYSRGLTGAGRRNYGPLQSLFSGSPAFHLRHLQSLSAFSRDGRRLALSERTGQTNNEYAIIVMNADGTARQQVFYEKGSAAMGPQWSQDGNSIVFGLGGGFQTRNTPARIMMMRPDGSDVRTLTTGPGAGFPSLSPDGKRLVFRVWGPGAEDRGLRILTLETGAVARLTGSEYDTFPGWSPKGDVIAFSSWRNGDYDIYTIRPDGTGLNQLTTAKGNDAHSSWSPDGEFLMFSSSRFGFKDEAALFDGQPQPYGEIFVMKADGSDQRPLTDNQWEDGPGAWEPLARQQSSSASARPTGTVTSLYDLKTDTLLGKPAELASYRGKVTLVVNVASECGFTPQYEGLEKLHRELSGKGFAVLGFPSNDFGGQEPGTAQEIATFCRLNYGVTFPMFAKVSTVAGLQQSPIYKFLAASGNLPAWNFSKYVVGKDGKVVAFFPSKVTPDAPELRSAIAKALGSK